MLIWFGVAGTKFFRNLMIFLVFRERSARIFRLTHYGKGRREGGNVVEASGEWEARGIQLNNTSLARPSYWENPYA